MQRRRLQLEIALPENVPACGVVILGAWAFLRLLRLGRATFKNDSKVVSGLQELSPDVHFQKETFEVYSTAHDQVLT